MFIGHQLSRLFRLFCGTRTFSLPFCEFERRILRLALLHLFSSSSLGCLLRSLIYRYILSRFWILLLFILRIPTRLCIAIFRTIDTTSVTFHDAHLCPPSIRNIADQSALSERTHSLLHLPPSSASLHESHLGPPCTLRLLSDDLPLALHSHIQRSDFDPDFVATLLSRGANDDVVDIILDTGCTFAITHDRKDFIEYHTGSVGNVQTVNGPTAMVGYGLVRWTLISEDGSLSHLVVPCHHVPASNVRLLSPQDYCLYAGLDRSRDQYGGTPTIFG